MAYKSPIRLVTEIEHKIIEDQMEGVYKAVLAYKIDIGKDELFQLLYGDRKQYEKGFEDGWKERDISQVRCKDCKYSTPQTFYDKGVKGLFCNYRGSIGDWRYRTNDDYCSRGERKESEEC